MSTRKKSVTTHGKNGERDVSAAKSRRCDNPIIEAVQRCLRGKRPTIVFDVIKSMPDGAMREWIARRFSDAAIRQIGVLIIESLLMGDRRMVKVVKDAIKQADHLFNRDREPVLLRKALVYYKFQGGWKLGAAAFKKAIEKEFNNGQKLPQHRWNRIRRALGLAKLPTGRPKKVRHETA